MIPNFCWVYIVALVLSSIFSVVYLIVTKKRYKKYEGMRRKLADDGQPIDGILKHFKVVNKD